MLGPGQHGRVVDAEGIKGDLTDAQKKLLLDLIAARLGFMNEDDYAAKIETVVAEIDETYFGWWGPRPCRESAISASLDRRWCSSTRLRMARILRITSTACTGIQRTTTDPRGSAADDPRDHPGT